MYVPSILHLKLIDATSACNEYRHKDKYAPIPYNRYPPLNPVKFYTHIYIHTHFGIVPLATVAGYLLQPNIHTNYIRTYQPT